MTLTKLYCGLVAAAALGMAPTAYGDSGLENKVREALAEVPTAQEVEIDWQNGELVLHGKRMDPADADAIVVEAARIPGVNTIVNKLYVS